MMLIYRDRMLRSVSEPLRVEPLPRLRGWGRLYAALRARVQEIERSFTGENHVNLSAKKLAALTQMSNEIAEDAVISVADTDNSEAK